MNLWRTRLINHTQNSRFNPVHLIFVLIGLLRFKNDVIAIGLNLILIPIMPNLIASLFLRSALFPTLVVAIELYITTTNRDNPNIHGCCSPQRSSNPSGWFLRNSKKSCDSWELSGKIVNSSMKRFVD